MHWLQHITRNPKTEPIDWYLYYKEINAFLLQLSEKFQQPNEHSQKTMLFDIFQLDYHIKFQRESSKNEKSIKSIKSIINSFKLGTKQTELMDITKEKKTSPKCTKNLNFKPKKTSCGNENQDWLHESNFMAANTMEMEIMA